MRDIAGLFRSDLVVANIGSRIFADAIDSQDGRAVQVDWAVPCSGDEGLISILKAIRTGEVEHQGKHAALQDLIDRANSEVLERINMAHPMIVGIGRALDEIPGMEKDLILHAGPPVEWDRMCGPMKGAVIGALIYEGLAKDEGRAREIAASGDIRFEPCHHHSAVGPMAGIVSPSMPVWIVDNRHAGNRAFCTLNEGLGKVLRYGAFSGEVIGRLTWMADVLAPVLKEALATIGEIDLRTIIAQALQMGDECHNRNKAGTSLLIRELAPAIAEGKADAKDKRDVLKFMHMNDHFFLNLSMPAGKSALDAAAGVAGSSVIIAMARNGTDFGIRLSSLPDTWFTAPAPEVKGLYFPGYGADDANPDIGDSTICETYGIGGFAMAAAPAIVEFVGGTPADAISFTLSMYGITVGESKNFRIPSLGFRGTPTAIDVTGVVEKGIVPAVNTGIAHKDPGVGQVGAGLVEPPLECFEDALRAFYQSLTQRRKTP